MGNASVKEGTNGLYEKPKKNPAPAQSASLPQTPTSSANSGVPVPPLRPSRLPQQVATNRNVSTGKASASAYSDVDDDEFLLNGVRQPCKYWDKCYRDNVAHLSNYVHPRDFERYASLPQDLRSDAGVSVFTSSAPVVAADAAVEKSKEESFGETSGISKLPPLPPATPSVSLRAPIAATALVPETSLTVSSVQVTASAQLASPADITQTADSNDDYKSDQEGSVISSVSDSAQLPQKFRDGCTVQIENLPCFVKEKEVRDVFIGSGFRPVRRFNLIRRGKRDCICKMNFNSEDIARSAAEKMNGYNLDGRRIRVRHLTKTNENFASDGAGSQPSIRASQPIPIFGDVRCTGRVTALSPKFVFIDSKKPLPGDNLRSVFYPPSSFATTLPSLLKGDIVSFRLSQGKKSANGKDTRPLATNLIVEQYSKRPTELIESYINSLPGRLTAADPQDIEALIVDVAAWNLLGENLFGISTDSLLQLLNVMKLLFSADSDFFNSQSFASFTGYKFLHLGNALNKFIKDELRPRNFPMDLQILVSFLTSVASTMKDPILPNFICYMSLGLGSQGMYKQSITLMDALRKNKDIGIKAVQLLPTYEEMTVIPWESDPEACIRLNSYFCTHDYMESVAALLRIDTFSRISNVLAAELVNRESKFVHKGAVLLREVEITEVMLSQTGSLLFRVNGKSCSPGGNLNTGALFILSQDADFAKFVFGSLSSVETGEGDSQKLVVEIFRESMGSLDAAMLLFPKKTTKMIVVQTPALKFRFLTSLNDMIKTSKETAKTVQVLQILADPFSMNSNHQKAFEPTIREAYEKIDKGEIFQVSNIELSQRETQVLAKILERHVSAVQIHPGVQDGQLLLVLLSIVSQSKAPGPILYLTKEDHSSDAIQSAIQRIVKEDVTFLNDETLEKFKHGFYSNVETLVSQMKKEVDFVQSVIGPDPEKMSERIEKLIVEEAVKPADIDGLRNHLKQSCPNVSDADIHSFIAEYRSECAHSEGKRVGDFEFELLCDATIRFFDAEIEEKCNPNEKQPVGKPKAMHLKRIEDYAEYENRPNILKNNSAVIVAQTAVGHIRSDDQKSCFLHSYASHHLCSFVGSTLENLSTELEKSRKNFVSDVVKDLLKSKLVVVFGDDFGKTYEYITLLSPSMIVVNNANLWSDWELVPLIKPSVKQLILLGDLHLMNSSVDNLYLSKRLDYCKSLFERVFWSQGQEERSCLTLFEQGVARPEMFDLLSDVYLPNIETLKGRKQFFPAGLVNSLFLWSHDELDSHVPAVGSVVNHGEATRVVTVANYLVENGTSPTDITVITPFLAQSVHLRQKLKKLKLNIEVHLVHDFLVQRNNTVLVSLVKSRGDLGILEDVKVRCSLLSRANSAMIIFANVAALLKSEAWSPVVANLVNKKAISHEMHLCCPNHRKTRKAFTKPHELNQCIQKHFCGALCEYKFPCGHNCDLPCRPHHTHERCNKVLEFQHPDCKHTAERKCFEATENCEHVMEKTFECGHTGKIRCGVQQNHCKMQCNAKMPCGIHFCKTTCEPPHDHLVCLEEVPMIHPECKHDTYRKCNQSITQVVCMKKSLVFVPSCGHTTERLCYQKMDQVICNSKCLELTNCEAHPRCEMPCKGTEPHQHTICRGEVEVVLAACGHASKRFCSQDESQILCKEEVTVTFKLCKHSNRVACWERSKFAACKKQCQEFLCKIHRCSQNCEPSHDHPKKCLEPTAFTYPACRHVGSKPCFLPERDAIAILCEYPVRVTMPCGRHEVSKKCFEIKSVRCDQPCATLQLCGHICSRPCHTLHDHKHCAEKVKYARPCGRHFYEVLCGLPQEVAPCTESVSHTFPCGDTAMVKCHQSSTDLQCLITRKKVFTSCRHEKIFKCSEYSSVTICLGYPCRKKLPCGHFCNKKCGETCDETGCPACRSLLMQQQRDEQDAEWKKKKLLRKILRIYAVPVSEYRRMTVNPVCTGEAFISPLTRVKAHSLFIPGAQKCSCFATF